MPTEHHYTRQTPNGKPASGSTRPGESAHSARPQGNSAQRHSSDHSHLKSHSGAPREQAGAQAYRSSYPQSAKGSNSSYAANGAGHSSVYDGKKNGSSGYARNEGYYSAYDGKNPGPSAYAKSAGSSAYAKSASYPPKKKKKKTLKRLWKKFCKKMFVVEEKPVDDLTYAQNTRAAVSVKPFTAKAKKTLVSVLRTVARAVFLFFRRVYQYLMKLPPRTLLIGSGTLGAVLVTAIILAIALPGKQDDTQAQQQLAAFASDETQTAAFDSGTIDPYANSETAPETQASVADPSTDTTGQAVDATTPQAGAITLSEELKAGDDGEIVSTIQTRLMELGYMDSDEPTQHFGPLTKSALKAFQRHNGLDDDGICGQTTFDILQKEDAKVYVMQLGDSGPDVEGIQQRLYELGYLDNKANIKGVFGDKTEAAVKLFQKKNELTADGKVGDHTLEMLYGEEVVSNAYRLGDKNQVIEDCQIALKRMGYLTFKPDGEMGKATVTAIKAFQQANGLTRDGALGPVTRDMILSGEAQEMVLQIGDYGTNVKNVQARLAKLNYLASANATGYFGEITADAVKAFQKRSGLTQDGKIGAVTLTMLNSSSAKKAVSPPSTSKETKSGSSSSSSGSSSSGSSGSVADVSDKSGVEKIVALAESKLGSTYVRGAKGPNTFDCSGFVYWCLKNSGVSTSYMTSIAWRSTSRFQRTTSMGSLQRGDILVFSGSTDSDGHVGIYLGGGKMIDASSSEGKVRMSSSVLNSGGYWSTHFICAYRVF
ncbi:MAG: peptidoglycan-binding protein [Christensenella sp.]|nr:peptidoglycan-binding protein [Christensenella sp.]